MTAMTRRIVATCHHMGLDTSDMYKAWCACRDQWGVESPAALGCLLALARLAWGDPDLLISRRRMDGLLSISTHAGPCTCGGGHWRGETETEVLVNTIEAAPQREAPSRMSALADPGPPLPAWVELVSPSKVGGS